VLEPLKEISSQEVIKNIQDVFKKKTGKKKIKVKTKRRAPDHRSTRAQERLKRQKRRTRRKS
jgi:hypothetical protein